MASKSDGSLPYGSRVLSFGTAPSVVTYIADNIDVVRPSKALQNTDQNDEPTGAVYVPGFVTGSATLQLSSSSVHPPTLHDEFKATFLVAEETFIVTEVGQPESKDGLRKCRISFAKKYNVT